MSVNVTSLKSLKAVAALAPVTDLSRNSQLTNSRSTQSDFRRLIVSEWMKDREVRFHEKAAAREDGRKIYVIDECPFDKDHGERGEVCIMQDDSGRTSFKCQHESCSAYGWKEACDAIGKPDSHHYEAERQHEVSLATGDFIPQLMNSSEFDAADFRQNYLVEKVLVEGQPCIVGGPKKCLKTGTLVDLAVSLGTATPFLSHKDFAVPEPVRTCILSGESGAFSLRNMARRVCQSRDVLLADADILWGLDLPQLANPRHLLVLHDTITEQSIRVLIVDPAYLCLLSGTSQINPGNVFAMGEILKEIGDLGTATGCTIIIAHHTRKATQKRERFQPTDLEDLAMSGFAEFARQWILLGRRIEYESDGHHRIWLSVGGSAGHSGCYAVNVDEGPPNGPFSQRTWLVEVEHAARAIEAEKVAKHQRQSEERMQAKLNALKKKLAEFPDGQTKSQLRDMTKPRPTPDDFEFLMAQLIDEGKAEACQIKKNNRSENGYRPVTDF